MSLQKYLLSAAISLASIAFCFGQVDTTNLDIIKAGFNNDIGKRDDVGDSIIYLENVSRITKIIKEEILKTSRFVDINNHKDGITLTKKEQKFIGTQLDSGSNFIWPENLFKHSKRIRPDQLVVYTHVRYDSIPRNALIADYVYGFSKPVYIRNKTIALVGFTRICGGLCGNTETAFYRYQNGEWVRFVTIEEGIF